MNGDALIEMRLLSLHTSLRVSTLCLTTITESDCVQALMDLLTARSLCISTMTRKKIRRERPTIEVRNVQLSVLSIASKRFVNRK